MSRKHQQERSEAVKQMILDAALNISLEEGNSAVTVRHIGEKIGYSTGVIYYHFKDKQDIIDELNRRLDAEALETVKSFADSDLHPAENVKRILTGIYNVYRTSYKDYCRLFAVGRVKRQNRQVWEAFVYELVKSAYDRGEIKSDNLRITTTCLLSYIIGCNQFFLDSPEYKDIDPIDHVDTVVSTITEGFCK